VGAQEGLLPARNIAGVAIQQHARQNLGLLDGPRRREAAGSGLSIIEPEMRETPAVGMIAGASQHVAGAQSPAAH
jgi:hypothetical protein